MVISISHFYMNIQLFYETCVEQRNFSHRIKAGIPFNIYLKGKIKF